MATVDDLAIEIGATIMETQSLGAASQKLEAERVESLVVLDLQHRAIGVFTTQDLEIARTQDPQSWTRRLCLSVLELSPAEFRPSDTVADLLARYRESGVRPVLVREPGNEAALRVVPPSAVFRWCAEHQPDIVEELSELAATPPRE